MDDTKETKAKETAEEKALQNSGFAAGTEASERLFASALPAPPEKSSALPNLSARQTGGSGRLTDLDFGQDNHGSTLRPLPVDRSAHDGSPAVLTGGSPASNLEGKAGFEGKTGFEFAQTESRSKDQSRIPQDSGLIMGKSQSRVSDGFMKGQSSPDGGSISFSKDQSRIAPQENMRTMSFKEGFEPNSVKHVLTERESLPNTTIIEKTEKDPYSGMGAQVVKDHFDRAPLSFDNPKLIHARVEEMAKNSAEKTYHGDPTDPGYGTGPVYKKTIEVNPDYHVDRTNKGDLLSQLKDYKGATGACNVEEAKQNGSGTSFASKEMKLPDLQQNAYAIDTSKLNADVMQGRADMLREKELSNSANVYRQLENARVDTKSTEAFRQMNMSEFSTQRELTAAKEFASKDFGRANDFTASQINSMKEVSKDFSSKDFSSKDFTGKDFSSAKDYGVKEMRMEGREGSSRPAEGSTAARENTGKEELSNRLGGGESRISSEVRDRQNELSPNSRSQTLSNETVRDGRSTPTDSSATPTSRTLQDTPVRSHLENTNTTDSDRKSRTIDLPSQQATGSVQAQIDRTSQASQAQTKADAIVSLARQSVAGPENEIASQAAKGLAAAGFNPDRILPASGQRGELTGDRAATAMPVSIDKNGNPITSDRTSTASSQISSALNPGDRSGLQISSADRAGLTPAADRVNPGTALTGQERGLDLGAKVAGRAEDAALGQIGRKDAGSVIPGLSDRTIQSNEGPNGARVNTGLDALNGSVRVNADGRVNSDGRVNADGRVNTDGRVNADGRINTESTANGKPGEALTGRLLGGEKIGDLTVDANGKAIRTADGQIIIGKSGAVEAVGGVTTSSGSKPTDLIIVDGEVTEVDENGVPLRRFNTLTGNKRYLTGVELTIAAVIAMSGAAKVREEMLMSDPDGKNNTDEDGNRVLHRRTHLVSHGETLQSIAEALYQNPAVAWLIADMNATNLKEDIIDGRRVVELQTRQQLELPEPEEVTNFLNNLRRDFEIDQLVTVVSENTIDRELLNNFLGTVTGGVTPGTSVAARKEEEPAYIPLPELSIDLGNPEDMPVGLGIASLVRDLSSRVGRLVKRPERKLRTV